MNYLALNCLSGHPLEERSKSFLLLQSPSYFLYCTVRSLLEVWCNSNLPIVTPPSNSLSLENLRVVCTVWRGTNTKENRLYQLSRQDKLLFLRTESHHGIRKDHFRFSTPCSNQCPIVETPIRGSQVKRRVAVVAFGDETCFAGFALRLQRFGT